MRHIDEIIIHCSDTRPNWMQYEDTRGKVHEIRRWHVEENKWSDIGYHYLVDRNGTVAEGRSVEKVGAHVKGHNTNSIGICLLGGHGSTRTDKFEDNFTYEQDKALRRLISQLVVEHPDIRKFSGHNEYANKACPGFNVRQWMERVPDHERTSVVQSKTVQASAVQIASGAGSAVAAVSAFEGTAQIVALALAGLIVLAGMFIMRERLKAWAAGWR